MALAVEGEVLPDAFATYDQAARDAQRVFFRSERLRLACLCLAAVATVGVLLEQQVGAGIAGILLAAALGIDLYLANEAPGWRWHKSRQAAESIKSLAWRYAMACDPYPADLGDRDAVQAYIGDVQKVTRHAGGIAVKFLAEEQGEVTSGMRRLRSSPVSERLVCYRDHRLQSQRRWYERRTEQNHRAATWWQRVLAAGEVCALATAILAVLGVPVLGLVGVITTAIAGGLAWTQVKRQRQLAMRYADAARQLKEVDVFSEEVEDESDLRRLVERVEVSISREHTTWLPGPVR